MAAPKLAAKTKDEVNAVTIEKTECRGGGNSKENKGGGNSNVIGGIFMSAWRKSQVSSSVIYQATQQKCLAP